MRQKLVFNGQVLHLDPYGRQTLDHLIKEGSTAACCNLSEYLLLDAIGLALRGVELVGINKVCTLAADEGGHMNISGEMELIQCRLLRTLHTSG